MRISPPRGTVSLVPLTSPALVPRLLPASPALERSQLVWRRALELTGEEGDDGRLNVPLDLLRTAHHDVTTLAHARALGRTRVRNYPDDTQALAAVARLGRAITFLGVRPAPGDVAAEARRW